MNRFSVFVYFKIKQRDHKNFLSVGGKEGYNVTGQDIKKSSFSDYTLFHGAQAGVVKWHSKSCPREILLISPFTVFIFLLILFLKASNDNERP